MQGYNIDESKLIVSWNRYEQGLMKAHLMNCTYNSTDLSCFGDYNEVCLLHQMLVKHGVLQQQRNYNNTNLQQLVGDIKYAIQQNLQNYNGNQFSGSQWYYINNNNETVFLTRFAMAIQDTKIRGMFYPENINHVENGYACYASYDNNNNLKITQAKPKLTIAKARLFSLATQLTRIGLNCRTTVRNSNNLRGQDLNAVLKPINFIDTNNFLGKGALRMDQLGIGMNPPQYYFNLYRKLFDFALKREWDRKQSSQQQKIPRFLIPLTGYWGTPINAPTYGKCVDMNIHIKQALEKLFNTKYNASQTYGDLIAVDIVDFNNENSGLFKNWQYGHVLNKNSNIDLFNNPQYEEYAIGSGDHYTFIGNECMDCWKNNGGTASSHEAFAMKTDFPKFYEQNGQFANNGYYKIIPSQFQMPTDYQLHMNYLNDIIVPMNGINKGINYNTQYGTNNFYPQYNKNY